MKPNFKCCLQAASQPWCASSALLLLRLIVGAAFIFHGWGKIQTPFSWMPAEAPIHIPAFFQFLAAVAEFGGGIGLILGLLTPIWALGLIGTMAVATYMHMIVFKDPFVSSGPGGSYEPALGYLGVAILFFVLGPGRFSLDAIIFGKKCAKEQGGQEKTAG